MSHRSRCLVVGLRPFATSRALYRLKDLSALYLCLYNHIRYANNVDIWLARNSTQGVIVNEAFNRHTLLVSTFTIPTLERVTIECCEVGDGGGGGVVGGVGVVCGDGVDSGVGGVDCGVVCGFVCGVVCGGVY
ncbi:hypothetical protein Tco_1026340 [Tanacetum coccineum]